MTVFIDTNLLDSRSSMEAAPALVNWWKLKTVRMKKEQRKVQPTGREYHCNGCSMMIRQHFDRLVASVTRRVPSNTQTRPSQSHFLYKCTDGYDAREYWLIKYSGILRMQRCNLSVSRRNNILYINICILQN